MSSNVPSILSDPLFQGAFQKNTLTVNIVDELEQQEVTVGEKLDSLEGSALTIVLAFADLATGGLTSKAYEALQKYNDEVEKIKLHKLLEGFLNQYTNTRQAVEQIFQLIGSPEGFVLFQKLLAIQSGPILDFDFSRQLAVALKRIADSDFKDLFNRHKYALLLLDSLSPQSLALLVDHKNWPFFELKLSGQSSYPDYRLDQIGELRALLEQTKSMIMVGQWEEYFAEAYFKEQTEAGVDDETVKLSITTAMYDLSLKGLARGSQIAKGIGGAKVIGASQFLLSEILP
jgi:hypothetical protein